MQDPTCLLSSQNAFHKEKAYIKKDLYVYVCNEQTKFTENNVLGRNSSFDILHQFSGLKRTTFCPLVSTIKRDFEINLISFPVFKRFQNGSFLWWWGSINPRFLKGATQQCIKAQEHVNKLYLWLYSARNMCRDPSLHVAGKTSPRELVNLGLSSFRLKNNASSEEQGRPQENSMYE